MARKTKSKLGAIVESAVDAAEELGHAAEDLKSSWNHVEKARAKGDRALRPVKRAGRRALSAAKSAVRKTTAKIKRAGKK